MCKLNFIRHSSLVTNKEILPKLRTSFKISDQEFSFLCDIVSVPAVVLVKREIFTQGIVDKIINGGSDHQKLHLTHREIVFGIGYAAVGKILLTPTPVDIDLLIEQDPFLAWDLNVMDRIAAENATKLNVADKTPISIQGLGKKALEKEKDKELVFKSFITFVKEELSDDHNTDVQTALEILQDCFTVEELFAKLTGSELPVGHQLMGWKNVSGISLEELVNHTITISRRSQAVYKKMAELNSNANDITLDENNLKPDVHGPCEAWIMINNPQHFTQGNHRQHAPSLSQEVLKTKRPDHTLGDKSQVIDIKLMNNDNWRNFLQGLVKIFDERIAEQQAKAKEIFNTVLNQIRSGEISYEQVKEKLALPNIHTKNKYDTKYIIRQLGGSPAVKEAIGIALENMDEKECIAILKFHIALYQQDAGKFDTKRYDQIRSQVGKCLNALWREAVTLHATSGVPGISRHYKDDDLEMMVVCELRYGALGFPAWKTRVNIIRSKHFATGKSLSFSSLEFNCDQEDYRNKVMKKILRA